MSEENLSAEYKLPWYDSRWLCCYRHAKDILRKGYPGQLEEFEQAFDILRTDLSFEEQHIKNFLPEARIAEFRKLISELPREAFEKHELLHFGRFVIHDQPEFVQLQLELLDEATKLAGEPLEPSYSFLALYHNLGNCLPHMDAPLAKWTLDICLDQTDVWPIYFSKILPWPEDFDNQAVDNNWHQNILNDKNSSFTEYRMKEGEALFFSGSSQWHYRPRIEPKFKQNYCHLLFLHYYPRGARSLLDPNNWAEMFSIPEFTQLYYPDTY